MKVFVARAISVLVCLTIGGALQIALWKTAETTYLDALFRHPYLWIAYILAALLVGEHALRLMKRRSSGNASNPGVPHKR